MIFNVISIFPQMFQAVSEFGVIGQAVKAGKIELCTINPRDFTEDFHKTVDDRPYGGGDGMVMLVEPLRRSLEHLKAEGRLGRVIYLSPQGKPLVQAKVKELMATEEPLTLICGRYGGIDERLLASFPIEEISVGDFIVSGGELPAMLLIDAVGRLIPGVLGHAQSAELESFADGLLEAPLFTRPREISGLEVPEVLVGGDHKKIQQFRHSVALVRTALRRPDLLVGATKSDLPLALENLKALPDSQLRACGLQRKDLEGLA